MPITANDDLLRAVTKNKALSDGCTQLQTPFLIAVLQQASSNYVSTRTPGSHYASFRVF
jgi:hypothetical protein